MGSVDHERLKDVLFEASRCPEAERSAYLDEACQGSVELRREVEALLRFVDDDAEEPLFVARIERPARVRFRRGQVLGGRFEIQRLLGRGGLGEVYAVGDRTLGVDVALKTLRSPAEDLARERLYQEVRLARQITHPGICRVFDVGQHESMAFLTMELVDGEDLATRLARTGPWTSAAVTAIGARLAAALAAAHAAGVLHRDLKPANILVDRGGAPRLTDFGIAALLRLPGDADSGAPPSCAGTPVYMAPESVLPGYQPNESADLYSLGIVLYELVTGSPPFDDADPSGVLELQRTQRPDPPSQRRQGVDPDLEELILRLLAKDPAERPSSALAVAATLQKLAGETAPPEAEPAERRPLVSLLCEVTSGLDLGDARDRDRLALLRASCARICIERGGHVAQQVERGLLVHFGLRRTTEHDVENAVEAALETLDSIARRSEPIGPALRAAISIDLLDALFPAGGSEIARSRGQAELVRLRALRVGEGVTVSATALPLLRAALQAERLQASVDQARAPGTAGIAVRRSARRGPWMRSRPPRKTPFVGRELELSQLLRSWESACAGHGQAVLLSGDAGSGKRALIGELWTRIAPDARGLEVHCLAKRSPSPLAPFVDLLRSCAGFAEDDDDATRRRKLRQVLEPLGPSADDAAPLFLRWLRRRDLEGSRADSFATIEERRRFLRALVDWILALSEQAPLLVVVHDVQWSDPTSLEALELLAADCGASPLLLLMASRPELVLTWRGVRLGTVALQPLRREETRALVEAAIARDGPLPSATVERIVESAEGNPLFAEQLIQEARERGSGRAAAPGEPVVPLTLRSLLQWRLDRLGPAKTVAQRAAVCGRAFRYELLLAIMDGDERATANGVDRLHDARILHQRGLPPRATYSFEQTLMREVAYASLPERQRRELHRKLAELLPVLDAETAQAHPAVVAEHWSAGGRPEQAFPWWRRACLLALERCAYAEAATALERARATLPAWRRVTPGDTATTELQILVAWLTAHGASTAVAAPLDIRSVLRRVRALCSRVEHGEELVLGIFYLVRFKMGASERRGLLELLHRVESLAKESGDAGLWSAVCSQRGHFLALQGAYAEAERYCEECLSSRGRTSPGLVAVLAVEPRVIAAWARSLGNWARGRTTELRRGAAAAVADADESGNAFSRAYAPLVQAVCLLLAGDDEQAARLARRGAELAAARDLEGVAAMARVVEAMVASVQGALDPERLEAAIAAWEGPRRVLFVGPARLVLASALERAGEHERALAVLTEACARSGEVVVRFLAPELRRRRGEVLRRLGSAADAEAEMRRALALARRDGASRLELRAATSLARLLAAGGSTRSAVRVLARTMAGLDAAVDTEERTEGEALLAELRARAAAGPEPA